MHMTSRAALKRYNLRIAIATIFYLAALALAVRVVRGGLVDGPLAWVLAILPGLAVLGIFWAFGRWLVEEQDEYRRRLLVGQSFVATAFTLSVATIWSFLENFGLVGHIDGFYLALLWLIGLGVGALVNRVAGRSEA